MQEELERKSISVTVQATKLTGRVMTGRYCRRACGKLKKSAIPPKLAGTVCAVLPHRRRTPSKIEVEDRIRSFERICQETIRSVITSRRISVLPRLNGPCISRQIKPTPLKPLSKNIRKRR